MNRIVLLLVLFMVFSCKKEVKDHQKNETFNAEEVNSNAIKESIKTTISFPSKDGLEITANIFKVDDKPVTVLLCHQAGFSRGEYKDTALKLNDLGYSVMAIDQRSGNQANGVINETAKRAKSKDLPTNYLDARQDIEASIDYVFKNNAGQKILLVGSSYSASLALLIGKDNSKVSAVIIHFNKYNRK